MKKSMLARLLKYVKIVAPPVIIVLYPLKEHYVFEKKWIICQRIEHGGG